jgi:hypothetical protein
MPKEPGEAQMELDIQKEANYVISVINPKKYQRQQQAIQALKNLQNIQRRC